MINKVQIYEKKYSYAPVFTSVNANKTIQSKINNNARIFKPGQPNRIDAILGQIYEELPKVVKGALTGKIKR